jgi:hypothetical protein
MMAFVLQDDGVYSEDDGIRRMMSSVTGVEDSPKKAISGLPCQRKTLSFFHPGDRSQSNSFP